MSGFPAKDESNQPEYCRFEAYHFYRRHFHQINTTQGLVRCALAASMHAMEDLDPQWVEQEIASLAEAVRRQCPSRSPTALVTHLHHLLFERHHYRGCSEDHYYHPRNSYLSIVLHTKRGLPILLALVYKAIAEELGLKVEGIHSRGHFLIRVHDGFGWMIVDPYHNGRVLNAAEACQFIGQLFNEQVQLDPSQLPIASHEQWITRILVNLAYAFDQLGCPYDCLAMNELLAVTSEE